MARSKQETLVAHATSYIYDCMYPNGDRPAGGQSSSLGLTTTIVGEATSLTFAAEVEYGQYITGGFWFKDAGNGTSLVSKTPAQSTDVNGKIIHGTMKNPTAGGNQGLHQSQFDSSNNPTTNDVNYWDAAEALTFPATLVAGDAILAGVSREAGQGTNWTGDPSGKDPVLKAIDVYTCVDHVPTTTEFRPSPVDRSQTRYDSANIVWGNLPSYSTAGITMPARTGYDGYAAEHGALEYFERGSERFFPVFIHDFSARYFHPTDHMEDYHEDIGLFLGEAFLLLCTDLSQSAKEQLALNLCQIGIDYYGVGKQLGTGDSSWWRMPLIVTGYLLNDADMRDCYINGNVTKRSREEEKLYYYPDRHDSGDVYNGSVPAGQTWAGHKVFFRKQYYPAVPDYEYESRIPNEWSSDDFKDESYRRSGDVQPFVSMALVIVLMDLRNSLNYDPLPEMAVRWRVDADTAAEQTTMLAAHTSNAIGSYQPTECTKSLGSAFMDGMWDAHATSKTWPSEGGTVERTL